MTMADMLGSKGNGACKCCDDPLVPKRVNRKREARAWRKDAEVGHYSTPDDNWEYADEDWLNAAGNYAAYLAQPTEARDPYAPYGQPHYRPLEREDHERGEAFKHRIDERCGTRGS